MRQLALFLLSPAVCALLAWWWQATASPHPLALAAARRRMKNRLSGARITFLMTNDLHSSAEGCCLNAFPQTKSGSYARLSAMIDRERRQREAQGEVVITVDAGDWYSGSPYSLLGPSDPSISSSTPELAFFERAGYDAVALGNHDLDAGEHGLFNMIQKSNNTRSVPILSSNLRRAIVAAGVHSSVSLARTAVIDGRDQPLGVCLLGIMSADAAMCSSGHRHSITFVGFDDERERKKPAELHAFVALAVKDLRASGECDVVAVLFHGGRPEDEVLSPT